MCVSTGGTSCYFLLFPTTTAEGKEAADRLQSRQYLRAPNSFIFSELEEQGQKLDPRLSLSQDRAEDRDNR